MERATRSARLTSSAETAGPISVTAYAPAPSASKASEATSDESTPPERATSAGPEHRIRSTMSSEDHASPDVAAFPIGRGSRWAVPENRDGHPGPAGRLLSAPASHPSLHDRRTGGIPRARPALGRGGGVAGHPRTDRDPATRPSRAGHDRRRTPAQPDRHRKDRGRAPAAPQPAPHLPPPSDQPSERHAPSSAQPRSRAPSGRAREGRRSSRGGSPRRYFDRAAAGALPPDPGPPPHHPRDAPDPPGRGAATGGVATRPHRGDRRGARTSTVRPRRATGADARAAGRVGRKAGASAGPLGHDRKPRGGRALPRPSPPSRRRSRRSSKRTRPSCRSSANSSARSDP